MKRVVSVFFLALLAVGLWLGPRATAMQSGTVPCRCTGFVSPMFHSNPVIASSSQWGNVAHGRCHKDNDPNCTMSAVPCQANVHFRLDAKPPFLPNFEMRVNGELKFYGGNFTTYTPSFVEAVPCGETALIQITADGQLALTAVVECFDCN